MNIKKLVRISFFAIVILIFSIFTVDQIVLYHVKENGTTKENITVLLSTQEHMDKLVQSLNRANHTEELVKIKQRFYTYKKIFKSTKKQLLSDESNDLMESFCIDINENPLVKSYILKLFKNEEDVELYFNSFFDLQSSLIEYQTIFEKHYLKENSLQKMITKDILRRNNFLLLKQLFHISI